MAFEPAQHSFITLEGVDGAGKSTQARLLARALELAGYQVVSLREPGGTAISEKIRALLLDPANTAMGDTCELLLYEAARAQLVHEVIAPALAAGKVVLCDRFYDSTTCYQAFADGLDRQMVRDANNLAVAGTHPALTLVYHITPEQAALRELYEELNRNGFALDTLSMGMSNDIEAAIAEGSTLVRVGTAIFGERKGS